MSLVHDACPALVRAFRSRAARRPPSGARASRDPMFRRRGGSFDLKNIRDYDPADDPRRIDWRLEARSGRLCVKEYYEEERDGVVVLADLSRSTEVLDPPGGLGARAESVAASLAWMLAALGDPVYLAPFGLRVLGRLERGRGGLGYRELEGFFAGIGEEGREGTDVMAALRSARAASRHRRVVVVSDFLDPGFSATSVPFGRAFLVQLKGDFAGLAGSGGELEVEDPESGRRLLVPWDAAAAAAYRHREEGLEAALRETERRGGFHRVLGLRDDPVPLYWDLLEALYA